VRVTKKENVKLNLWKERAISSLRMIEEIKIGGEEIHDAICVIALKLELLWGIAKCCI
jgi:hypothetical protein